MSQVIAEVNITELDKLVKNCERQYDKVVKQNKNLQSELRAHKKIIKEIQEIAELIVNDDDKPACVNEKNCPLNGGEGFDNHCNLSCPFILGKKIIEKIEEVM